MKIEQRKIEEIIPYENNPRINDDAVNKVGVSLEQYGWQQPIVVDSDGVVDAGLFYYNEIILVTAIGSLPIRAGRAMQATRKIGKTHQNILVFLKGDAKKAVAKIGDIDFNDFLSTDS